MARQESHVAAEPAPREPLDPKLQAAIEALKREQIAVVGRLVQDLLENVAADRLLTITEGTTGAHQ